MRKKGTPNARIKKPHFAWKEFCITFGILSILSAGQWLIYAEYMDFASMPMEYIFGMMGYWAIVSISFVWITHWQTRKKFDKPVRRLSDAAKEVADGDFSVYLAPIHTSDKYDYMDVLYEDFNKMVEELGTIETMKLDFISNVSHEIKTPLAIIENYASYLQKATITPNQQQEYTETIIKAAQKLNALVANILKLSKLENQKINPIWEPYDLCSQLAECALSFENIWESKNIEFIVEMDDKALIQADRNMLEVVWNNLLSNALKFTPPGGIVKLLQTSDNNTVTVQISDTGCGMDEKTLAHIFDKFYQGDTSHSQEGNGLGLALVLRVIELVGGQISAKSTPGEGSIFTVQLTTAQ